MQYIEILSKKNVVFTLLNVCVMLIIFIADMQFTTEIYMGILYIVVIMLSLWLPNEKYTLCFAVASTLLTSFGYFFSIYNISISTYLNITSFINLTLTISAIWITTIIAIYIKHMNATIKTSETIHKAILDASIDPIVILDQNGIIESASNALEKTFGWSAIDIKGKQFCKLLSSVSKSKYELLFQNNTNIANTNLIGNVQEVIGQHRMKRDFPCEISINYIYIPEIDRPLFTAVLRDISIRKTAEQKMGWLSSHDELTKIYNRRYFNEHIEREWKRLLRSQESLAIIIIDVDYFKNYNDYFGHQAGDSCLQSLASAIEECAHRSTDFAARYGGEEFVVVLPETNVEGAISVSESISAKIKDLNILHPSSKVSNKVTVSIGIATMVPSMGCSHERLIRFADQALYRAKESGRDRFSIHED